MDDGDAFCTSDTPVSCGARETVVSMETSASDTTETFDTVVTEETTQEDTTLPELPLPRPYLSIQVGDEDHIEHHGVAHPSAGSDAAPAPRNIGLFSSPTSCRSNASRASQMEFANADQTIILFDWDDTLCPSTYMMKTLRLGRCWDGTEAVPLDLLPFLQKLEDMVLSILEEALSYGSVVVVTNAEEGWIALAAKAWLPRVEAMLKRCKVVSARSKWEPKGIGSPTGWKQQTFFEEIETFYSRYRHQSWKNVISIGDAPHEREALFRVTRGQDVLESARRRKCRTKAIKFMIQPSVEQLVHELEMLQKCLHQVVVHDDDLDLQFDENTLPNAAEKNMENIPDNGLNTAGKSVCA